MTPIFNERNEGQPGLHALIAGVSAYSHLPGGTGVPARESFGMQQLSSTALTAYKIYCWLIDRQAYLPVPLATCRLLLSPSPYEIGIEPRLQGLTNPCILQNFLTEATHWRDDASSHPENIAFFYFAGHGVSRRANDAALLLEDFGDGIGGPLRNAIELNDLFNGMASSSTRPHMAQTQIYFVDACRIVPEEFKKFEPLRASVVFNDYELSTRDERRAPIFYAAVPGAYAYAHKNDQQTLFSKALFHCLNGVAGRPMEEEEQGQVKWHVSTTSLTNALQLHIDELNRKYNPPEPFSFTPSGYSKEMTIHYLDSPPLVDVVLEVDPLDALHFTGIEVRNDQGKVKWRLNAPLNPHPYPCQWSAGTYRVIAKIAPPDPRFVKYDKLIQVMPPRKYWRVRVAS